MALIPGNLLSYNHQSVETSIGNWADFANGASSVVQGSGTALEGTKSILSTRNATAGDVAMGGLTTTGNVPVVSPLTTYVYSFWVFTTVANTVWHAQNDWYQSNNTTFISTATGPDITVPASTWTEIRATQTSPALAGVARLFLQLRSGLASTNTANIDQVFFGSPVYAEPDRLFQPNDSSMFAIPAWGGAPDAIHDVIVYARTASITFVAPTRSAFLLLALASESGFNPPVHNDDPYAVSPPLLTPDDVTGGMQPWGGAPDSTAAAPATTVNAGVASVSFVAQAPSAGLGALPGTGSITLAAQTPTAAVGALPGTASVVVSAQAPVVGIAALPGLAAVILAGQQPVAGVATTAGVSSITFTGRSALAGPGGAAGVASITFAARDATTGIAPSAGVASVSLSAQAPTAGVSALPGQAALTITGQGPTAALGALPGTASIITSAPQEITGLAVLPSAAPVVLAGLSPSVMITEGIYDPSPLLFLPDDPYGGMLPWSGAPDGVITNDAIVNAGVASMIIAAQSPAVAVGVLPGVSSVSFVAQAPSAGLSALPATGSITMAANGPQAAVGARPGTASVSVSAQGPAVGLAVLPGVAPINISAQQASVPGATIANAGVAAILMSAPGPVAGIGVLAGTASVTFAARSASVGISALPAAAVVSVTARNATVVLPQTGTPTVISGREPLGQLYGREPTSSASGQDTGLISGREPLSSTSGTEPDSTIHGREP